jgi:hypothetical protein
MHYVLALAARVSHSRRKLAEFLVNVLVVLLLVRGAAVPALLVCKYYVREEYSA